MVEHDNSYKLLFSHARMVEDLLRGFVHEEWVEQLDFSTLEALIDWLKEPEQEGLRRAFVVWFKRVFLPARMPGAELPELQDLQEVRTMLAERVIEWTKQWKEEGRQEGEALVLRRLLTRRFGLLPPWVEERLAQADPETLERWAERVLEAATLEEVFEAS